MVQLPFSATAAAVLLGAVVAGGAIGVVTSPPTEAPSMQASTEPAATPVAAPAAEPANEPAAETPSPAPSVEQVVIETAPSPNPAPLQPENVVRQTETTTVVAAPVVVTGLGIASGCVGCIDHRRDDRAHRPVAKIDRPAPQHATIPHREIPPRVVFVRPPQVASVSAHSR